jgi:general secretion pathway protein H
MICRLPFHPPELDLRTRRGFTLLELILVMLILSLTIGIILPRVGAGWKRMEDREFLQEFVQTLRRARLQAMNMGEIRAFRIRGSERLYDLKTPPQKPIPENVDIYADNLEMDPATADRLILFYPDGSLLGNDLEIVFDKSRTFRVSVHPLFGVVQVSRAENR